MRIVTLIGATGAAFGPGFAYTAIHIVYGKAWSRTEMPLALSWYAGLVLALALNGVSEVRDAEFRRATIFVSSIHFASMPSPHLSLSLSLLTPSAVTGIRPRVCDSFTNGSPRDFAAPRHCWLPCNGRIARTSARRSRADSCKCAQHAAPHVRSPDRQWLDRSRVKRGSRTLPEVSGHCRGLSARHAIAFFAAAQPPLPLVASAFLPSKRSALALVAAGLTAAAADSSWVSGSAARASGSDAPRVALATHVALGAALLSGCAAVLFREERALFAAARSLVKGGKVD